ncbi:MAG: ribonucrease, partial [Bacteroidota bacterium]|nr:ribonucrease [Bacteroidota bacterium]
MEIGLGIAGLIIGALVAWYLTGQMANSRAKKILSDAEKDAEVIKKNKLLEAKEETLQMKAEVEKQANARLAKIQNVENRLKQREMQLNQRHEELNKKNTELDELKVNLDNQHELLEKKKQEIEKLYRQSLEKLETISG